MSDAEQEPSGNGDAELEDDVDDQVPADAGGEKEGAGEDESEASADSSDEEEDEGNEYEDDGFLVHEGEGGAAGEGEEDDDEGVVVKRKRKKRSKEVAHKLDEEDYDLLEENQVVGIKRPSGRKRLKSQSESGRKATNLNDFRQELFEGEDLEDEVEDSARRGGRDGGGSSRGDREGGGNGRSGSQADRGQGNRRSSGDRTDRDRADLGAFDDLDNEEDEMAGFIVDEDGGGGEDKSARRRRARARGGCDEHFICRDAGRRLHVVQQSSRFAAVITSDAIDIFGDDVDELVDRYSEARALHGPSGAGRSGDGGDDVAGDDGDPDDEDLDVEEEEELEGADGEGADEAREERARVRAELRRAKHEAKMQKQIYLKASKVMDPVQLARAHLRPEDQVVRDKDLPERLQALAAEFGAGFDPQRAAEWVEGRLRHSPEYSFVWGLMKAGIMEVDVTLLPNQASSINYELLVVDGDDWKEAQAQGDLELGSRRAVRRERGERESVEWERSDDVRESLVQAIKGVSRHDLTPLTTLARAMPGAVLAVLLQVHTKGEEIPLVGMFRKEVAQGLLVLRAEDQPRVASVAECARRPGYLPGMVTPHLRRMRRWDVLWCVYDLARKYQDLMTRRSRLEASLLRCMSRLKDEEYNATGSREHMIAGDSEGLQACLDLLMSTDNLDTIRDIQHRLATTMEFYPDLKADIERDAATAAPPSPSQEMAGVASQYSQGQATAAPGPKGSSLKKPLRGSQYVKLKAYGLQDLTEEVVLKPSVFADNLVTLAGSGTRPEGVLLGPSDWALNALSAIEGAGLPPPARNAEEMLLKVKAMAVQELIMEPGVRAALRARFLDSATLSTEPTESGKTTLDPFHKYGVAKHIRNKPITDCMTTDLYLRIAKAEAAGLIRVKIPDFKDAMDGRLFNDIEKLYHSDEVSITARQWDAFRSEVLAQVVDTLTPGFIAEFKGRMTAAAKDAALRSYSDALWDLATRAPLKIRVASGGDERRDGGEEDEDFIERPKLMPCRLPKRWWVREVCLAPTTSASTPSHPPTMTGDRRTRTQLRVVLYGSQSNSPEGDPSHTLVVMLNEQGNLCDFFYCGQLSGHLKKSGPSAEALFADVGKAKDVQKLKDKINEHVPSAILVGFSAPAARILADDIRHICDSFLENNVRFMKDQMEADDFHVVAADETIAALWENCAAAKSELREQTTQASCPPSAPPRPDPGVMRPSTAARQSSGATCRRQSRAPTLSPSLAPSTPPLKPPRPPQTPSTPSTPLDPLKPPRILNRAIPCPTLTTPPPTAPNPAARVTSPAQIRRAVALGRLHLDPLSILCSLAGPDCEITAAKLVDLQEGGALDSDDVARAAERVLVTAVAQVGVELNLAANVPWRAAPLAFVPGLGPRKAAALLKGVQRHGNQVSKRAELYRGWKLLSKVVFRNCGPYLRISTGGLPSLSNLELGVLDNSRIHPESYRMATSMVSSATGDDDVEAAVEEPSKLDALDLLPLVEPIAQPSGKGLATLIDIQQELVAPHGELRGGLRELTELQKFYLVHHESAETLKEGRLVEVKVTFVLGHCLKVQLVGCGAEGRVLGRNVCTELQRQADGTSHGKEFDDLRKYFGEGDRVSPKDSVSQHPSRGRLPASRLPPGSPHAHSMAGLQVVCWVFMARVIGVTLERDRRDDIEKAVVDLSLVKEDIGDHEKYERMYCAAQERYYEPTTNDARKVAQRANVQKKVRQLVKRPINHPYFKNISPTDATSLLLVNGSPAGTAIIRPDYRFRSDVLNITMVMFKGKDNEAIFHAQDVFEAAKAKGPAAHLTVALPLSIDLKASGLGTCTYEDLDELHSRYVEPLGERIVEVTSHRKFQNLPESDVEKLVLREHAVNRNATYYYIHLADKPTPQCRITFTTSEGKYHHETFVPNPDGFYFRQTIYTSLERMLAAFKKNPIGGRQHKQDAPPATFTDNTHAMNTGMQTPHNYQSHQQQQQPQQYGLSAHQQQQPVQYPGSQVSQMAYGVYNPMAVAQAYSQQMMQQQQLYPGPPTMANYLPQRQQQSQQQQTTWGGNGYGQ
ncbi:MAG: hypothetical protein WDW36_001791 [Sanguina aurantia]